jgi:hypothetical protein
MTFAEKIRSVGVVGVRTDGTDQFRRDREKRLELEQKYYRQARAEGSQPWGTQLAQSIEAMRESDRLGRPYRANALADTYHPEINRQLQPWQPYLKENA